MTRFALATALVAALAAPAFAQTQLESSVGAAPGQYTLSQLVELKFRQDNSGNEARAHFENNQTNFSARGRHNPTATEIFRRLAEESRGDGS